MTVQAIVPEARLGQLRAGKGYGGSSLLCQGDALSIQGQLQPGLPTAPWGKIGLQGLGRRYRRQTDGAVQIPGVGCGNGCGAGEGGW